MGPGRREDAFDEKLVRNPQVSGVVARARQRPCASVVRALNATLAPRNFFLNFQTLDC